MAEKITRVEAYALLRRFADVVQQDDALAKVQALFWEVGGAPDVNELRNKVRAERETLFDRIARHMTGGEPQ